ncbi:MAG: phosphotransferase [Propionibacteriaceae bacterium]|jgi:CTP:phosphocholine cytidylyltransferase-like protein|nr:phosphotransferase [Propionibacteriaceae bacterium]
MELSQSDFLVLDCVRAGAATSQRGVAEATGLSLGTVNAVLHRLAAADCVAGFSVTEAGRAALAPYRVDNAVILAAGAPPGPEPSAWERPRGLLEVRGERLVERLIRQLQAAGIADITLVAGYKCEQFLYLEDRFGVAITVTETFGERHSHASLRAVAGRLGRTYVCPSDTYFTANVFRPYVYHGYHAAEFRAGPTAEWGVTTGAHGRITSVRPGTADAWVMLGEACFDPAFSRRFRAILDAVYDLPETRPKPWEAVYADHIKDLDLHIRQRPAGTAAEFDSLAELQAFDPGFIVNLDPHIPDNICSSLGVERPDLGAFQPLRGGRVNVSFTFEAAGQAYVYRHPGLATRGRLDRRAEAEAEAVARDLGLDPSFICLDPAAGWKLSRFVEQAGRFDYRNPRHVAQALDLLRRLHTSGRAIGRAADLLEQANEIKARLLPGGPDAAAGRLGFPDFARFDRLGVTLYEAARGDGFAPVLCHNDVCAPNLLVQRDGLCLIDWEYAGMGDFAADLGTFICGADYTYEEAVGVFAGYFGRPPTAVELRHCVAYVALAACHWFVWGVQQDAWGECCAEWTYRWYRLAHDYGARALELYGLA